MDSISEILKGKYALSEKSISELKSIIRKITISKNEIFIKSGMRNQSEYLMLNGYCRSYVMNPEAEEITLAFFKKDEVLTPHLVRTKEGISLLNMQALSEVDLIEFPAAEFLHLMINNLEIREFGNRALLNELMRKTEKEIALATLTAVQRLELFRKEYAILENLIPHPMIASYLGITQVSLSRLRGLK
jgi:CRP-like cAMP-binding protein